MPLSMNFGKIHHIFSSLQSRNYRLYFIGQSISLIGTWMQSLAMSWLVYRLTGSVFLLGVIGFTSQAPSFVLSPFAGVFTDRFSRHRIMLITQVLFMLQALMMTALVMTHTVDVWHIVALSLVFGLITAFDAPARQSMVIDLIDNPENLGNAIALNSAMFNGARLFGPAIAGILIAVVGEGMCFLINALSYFSVIYALVKMKVRTKQKILKTENFKEGFMDGARYTFGFPPIRSLLLLLAVLSLVGLPYLTLLPAYTGGVLKGGSNILGFLMSATGAGALLGAIYLASRKSVLGLGKIIVFSSLFFGLFLIGFSLLNILWISLIIMFFTGLCMIVSIASINTLVQTLADEDKRGRVMSFYAMALMGMNPIGNLCAGSIASIIGISHTVLLSGIITLLAGIWFARIRPSLKIYSHPVFVRKGIIPKNEINKS
ncbi:MAG: MFS transporter [Bacteroidota bacterium]|nr:MFS transporter [Bacteroidota bacterium]